MTAPARPNLSTNFPTSVPDMKIGADLNNRKHGPHYDVLTSIPGGTDQVRVNSTGDIIGGTVNIGKAKL